MLYSNDVCEKISKDIINGIKVPHSVSQLVIHEEDGKYYLAVFVFYFDADDIKNGAVNRPTMWAIADIETGKIIQRYQTEEKDFSDAPYDIKYNVRGNEECNVPNSYYERPFKILDAVREKLITTGTLDETNYNLYLHLILAKIPEEYRRFYEDLSIKIQ